MRKIFDRIRAIFLVIIVLTAMALCGVRLMKLQIVQGKEYLEKSKATTLGSQTIKAARGEIVDSQGKAIVRNKVGFNVIVEKAFFPSDAAQQNDILLRVARLLEKDGLGWEESIPITRTQPYTYLEGREKDISVMLDDDHLRLAVYATAQDCIDELITKYKISDAYTEEEKRIIAGIRYEMLLRDFSVSNRYTFAQDIPMDTVAKLKELSYNFPGVDIVEEAIRVYEQGTILPHAIGTIGPIYAEEYAELKQQGYGLNDVIGKSGIEKAMEQYLRGSDGTREISISNGEVTSIQDTVEAIPGKTVQLTVDSAFQSKVQDILAEHISWLQDQDKGNEATAGSIAVLDVKTGAVRALVNYPNYDINDLIANYTEVLNRENSPLLNRAIDGLYRPGSTFKTVTATAALNEGIMTGDDTVYCNQIYTFYKDSQPRCLGRHGDTGVVKALQVSCNIYFYDVGRRTGIDLIRSYAQQYGLAQNLGLEIGGSTGYLAGPETFERFKMDWTPGQVLMASIGQSETAVTPLQMAVQAATIANRGVRYKPYLVDSIHTYNMEETLQATQPEVVSAINVKNAEMFDLIEEGMVMASKSLAARHTGNVSLTDLPYPVAIKTGTPETSTDKDNSAFIGYYPVGDPEIAFACMVEGGEYTKNMIRKIIDAYYGYETAVTDTTVSGTTVTAVTSTASQTESVITQTTEATVAVEGTPETALPDTGEANAGIETPFVQNRQEESGE